MSENTYIDDKNQEVSKDEFNEKILNFLTQHKGPIRHIHLNLKDNTELEKFMEFAKENEAKIFQIQYPK
jgi:hypothetical protein